jgi:hypothetical protein
MASRKIIFRTCLGEFSAYLKDESARYKAVIEQARIQTE